MSGETVFPRTVFFFRIPARPWQVGPHRKSVFVAPAGDLELVPREADVQAVEVLADLLADEGVRVVTRDVLLVRLPGLRVGDDRLELCHGILSERDASMRGFHIRLTPRPPGRRRNASRMVQRRCGKRPRIRPQSRYTPTTARPSAADMVLSSATASVICCKR